MTSICAPVVLLGAVLVGPGALADAPRVQLSTYRYSVTSPHLGTIGSYVRAVDRTDGVNHARSQLRISVRVMGVTVYRENADQNEIWSAGRLIAFQSMTRINATPQFVHGEIVDGRFMVTTSAGSRAAPADLSEADPWSSSHLGAATIISIRTGEILKVQTTGGESENLSVFGVPIPVRHFHVSTTSQPNRWEVWLDALGVPVKLRSLEHGREIDLGLVSQPMRGSASTER